MRLKKALNVRKDQNKGAMKFLVFSNSELDNGGKKLIKM